MQVCINHGHLHRVIINYQVRVLNLFRRVTTLSFANWLFVCNGNALFRTCYLAISHASPCFDLIGSTYGLRNLAIGGLSLDWVPKFTLGFSLILYRQGWIRRFFWWRHSNLLIISPKVFLLARLNLQWSALLHGRWVRMTVPEIFHILFTLLNLNNFLNIFSFFIRRLRMDLGRYLRLLNLGSWLPCFLLSVCIFTFDSVRLLLHLLDGLQDVDEIVSVFSNLIDVSHLHFLDAHQRGSKSILIWLRSYLVTAWDGWFRGLILRHQ